jgi:hypothetical protein
MSFAEDPESVRKFLKKANARLYKQMLQPGALLPHLTIGKTIAYVLAMFIHGVTLLILWVAVSNLILGIIAIGEQNSGAAMVELFVGGLALLAAFALRPRLGRIPKGALERDKFPAIYGRADRIAGFLKAKPVDKILISFEYNASYNEASFPRHRIMVLGLPLLAVLTPS